jgi:hypothetical protein
MTADQLSMLERQYLERSLLEKVQAAAELVLYEVGQSRRQFLEPAASTPPAFKKTLAR